MKNTEQAYLEQYKQTFNTYVLSQLSEEMQQRYRVSLVPIEQFDRRPYKLDVRLVYVGNQAHIAVYIVDLGRYRFTVKLLNLPGEYHKETGIGSGSFGVIVTKSVTGEEFVVKMMRSRKTTLEDVIMEVAITKLCAIYEIGPDVQTRIPFDVITYEDAFQFHLQKCNPVGNLDAYDMKKCKEDIQHCMQVLHSLHMAHRDIKPDNILWRSELGRFVLCDFGVAQYVVENVGFASVTWCAGSPKFMGPQMLRLLGTQQPGYVDLYYNDLWAWKHLDKISFQNQHSSQAYSSGNGYTASISSVADLSQQIPPRIQRPLLAEALQRPDLYEFYRLLHAATDLYEHKFNFKENLPKVQDKKLLQLIYHTLKKSANKEKLDSALQELNNPDLYPKQEKNCLWRDWKDGLLKKNELDSKQHIPSTLMQSHIANLMRLINSEQEQTIRKIKQLLKEKRISYEESLQLIKEQLVWRGKDRLARLIRSIEEAFQNCTETTITLEELGAVCNYVASADLSYDRRVNILHSLRNSLKKKVLDPFLLIAVQLRRRKTPVTTFVSYMRKEDSLEKRLFIAEQAFLFLKSFHCEQVGQVITQLLVDVKRRPIRFYVQQRIFIEQILMTMKVTLFKADYKKVQQFIEMGSELIRYGSIEDGIFLISTFKYRISLLLNFKFCEQTIDKEYQEYEKYRQYYQEICDSDSIQLVQRRAKVSDIPHSSSLASRQTGLVAIQQNQTSQVQKNILRLRKKYTSLADHRERVSTYEDQYHEIMLLISMGRYSSADEKLKGIEGKLMKENAWANKMYYILRGKVDSRIGNYPESRESLQQALKIKLYPTKYQQQGNIQLQIELVQVLLQLGKFQQSFDILNEIEDKQDKLTSTTSETVLQHEGRCTLSDKLVAEVPIIPKQDI